MLAETSLERIDAATLRSSWKLSQCRSRRTRMTDFETVADVLKVLAKDATALAACIAALEKLKKSASRWRSGRRDAKKIAEDLDHLKVTVDRLIEVMLTSTASHQKFLASHQKFLDALVPVLKTLVETRVIQRFATLETVGAAAGDRLIALTQQLIALTQITSGHERRLKTLEDADKTTRARRRSVQKKP
jgi:hypothetical protein